ncbi:MAG: hypothetical protein WCF98_02295 [Synechococcus sp. ELA057]|jgi:hypothetical protein
MYLLTIRDGLQTRHIGPYESPARAAADLDALLAVCGERSHWQIHRLEAPLAGACQAFSEASPHHGRGAALVA